VIGNGDILTFHEARRRRGAASGLMLARGALIKPWLFREIREGRELFPEAAERFALLWRFVELLRDHFGDGEKGRRRILYFLPWHLGFFCRYRPLPETGHAPGEGPLIHRRWPIGQGLAPLEGLLRDPRPDTHQALSEALLDSQGPDEALERALRIAAERPLAGDEAGVEESARLVAG
jgi:tRNA-dihydrouridine synthase 3